MIFRKEHNCNFWLFRGVIGDRPVDVIEASYGTRAIRTNDGLENLKHDSRTSLTFAEIQEATKLRLSVLLIDCEGCIEYIFSDQEKSQLAETLSNVRVIILEQDMPIGAPDCKVDCVDYAVWEKRFLDAGFIQQVKYKDHAFPFIHHAAYVRKAVVAN
jgi:hypothetical protein